jgi:hypothetical protein
MGRGWTFPSTSTGQRPGRILTNFSSSSARLPRGAAHYDPPFLPDFIQATILTLLLSAWTGETRAARIPAGPLYEPAGAGEQVQAAPAPAPAVLTRHQPGAPAWALNVNERTSAGY